VTCVFHDHIVGGDTVGGYEEEGFGVDLVDFAYFAARGLLETMFLDCIVLVVGMQGECDSCSRKPFRTLLDSRGKTHLCYASPYLVGQFGSLLLAHLPY